MESHETELCSKIYNTGKEQQIFLGFSNFENKSKRKQQTKQNLFGFLNNKPKIRNKANQS
jgi:hypothetical protein